MRPRFEGELREYGKHIKKEGELKGKAVEEKKTSPVLSPETRKELAQVEADIYMDLKAAATEQDTNLKTQRKVFEIQRTKQAAMDSLRLRLACLDNPECNQQHDAHARGAEYDANREVFLYKD